MPHYRSWIFNSDRRHRNKVDITAQMIIGLYEGRSITEQIGLLVDTTLTNDHLSLVAPLAIGVLENAAALAHDRLNLITAASIGVTESAIVANDHLSLLAAALIGVDEAAAVNNNRLNLITPTTIGLDEAAAVNNNRLNLITAASIGVDESALLANDHLSLVAAESIGLLESALVTHDHLSLSAPTSIGLSETATITHDHLNLITAAMIGVTESATITHDHLSLVVHESIGVTESATLDHHNVSIRAAESIGVNMSATIKQIDLISAAMSIGLTESATVSRIDKVSAAMSVGVTEAATVTVVTPGPTVTLQGTKVLGGGSGNGSGNGTSYTISVNIPAGATIVIWQFCGTTQSNPTAPSDGHNSYTIFQSTTLGSSGSNGIMTAYVVTNCTAVNGNVTFSNPGGGHALAAVWSVTFTGNDPPGTVSTAGTHGTSSAPSSGTTYGSVIGSGYLTGHKTLFIGFIANSSIATQTVSSSGYTNTLINDGGRPGGATGYRYTSSSAATGDSYAESSNGGSQPWAAAECAIQW